jgi:hypothetical protein
MLKLVAVVLLALILAVIADIDFNVQRLLPQPPHPTPVDRQPPRREA